MKSKNCKKCNNIKKLKEFYLRTDTGKYRNTCIECDKKRISTWVSGNRNKVKKYKRNWNRKNLSYYTKRCKTDKNFKLAKILRGRLYMAIKGNAKIGSAVESLGCTIDEFRKIIESKFYPHPETGEMMTWDNYGLYGWHLDHIIPLSSFNLINKKQFNIACHYTNLQPLWAEENLSKGSAL